MEAYIFPSPKPEIKYLIYVVLDSSKKDTLESLET